VGFAPTVLPIAAAYELAHNYPFVLRNLGTLLAQLATIATSASVAPIAPLEWLTVGLFWGSQVLLIVLGHVIAVVAAHRVALARTETAGQARRMHAPLVVLMVGYTVLSLWIVSRPIATG
jgi:ABC-type amino acid transport system permease subunit